MSYRSLIILGIAAIVMGGASACSKKGTEGVDREGLCTQATIDSNNTIVSVQDNRGTVNEVLTKDTLRLKAAEAECGRFVQLLGSDSCKATNATTREESTINQQTTQAICSSIRASLHPEENSPNLAPPVGQLPHRPLRGSDPQLLAKTESQPLAQVKDRLSLAVQTSEFYKRSVFLIQGGRLILVANGLMPGIDYCQAAITQAYPLKNSFPVNLLFGHSSEVRFVNQAVGFDVTCYKKSLPLIWTVQNAREVFGATVDLKIVNAQ